MKFRERKIGRRAGGGGRRWGGGWERAGEEGEGGGGAGAETWARARACMSSRRAEWWNHISFFYITT